MVLRLIEERPSELMPKDTTPSGGRTVKYRVVGRTFVNGALAGPRDGEDIFVMGVPGLHGGPLEQVDPPLNPPAASAEPVTAPPEPEKGTATPAKQRAR